MRKKIGLLMLLLLLFGGAAVARSSLPPDSPAFAIFSGGTSTSASYRSTTVIGQPSASTASSASYGVSTGLLRPGADGLPPNLKDQLWLPLVVR